MFPPRRDPSIRDSTYENVEYRRDCDPAWRADGRYDDVSGARALRWASVRDCRLTLTGSDAWSERSVERRSGAEVWYRDIHPFRLVTDARLSLHAGELLVNDA